MNAIRVGSRHFTGSGRVYDNTADGLAAIARGLAIDHARTRIENANVADWTDNTTGTDVKALADIPIPAADFNATSVNGVQTAAINTSFGKVKNAFRVLTNSLNNARARVGLPILTAVSGSQAAADTLPAQDLTATGATGNSAVSYASMVAALTVIRSNSRKLSRAFNELMAAIGEEVVPDSLGGSFSNDYTFADIPTVTSSADGTHSMALADGTAALVAIANNLASLAAKWNTSMIQGGISDLTDSTGGTASGANTIVANALPAAANGAATTSAPKAGFDAQVALVANAQASLASCVNLLRRQYNLPLYTDSTGGTVSTTLSAESNALSAVDGSSGTSAVDQVTARDRMSKMTNNNSTLAAAINDLAPFFGVQPITDSSGGTPSVSNTLVALAATGTGVGGSTGTPTLLNADVNTWLGHDRDNIATLTAVVNAMTGTGVPPKPLHVVADIN